MKWGDLFGKKASTVPQQAMQAQPVTLNPGKREQAVRAVARLGRLYATRDKHGSNPELEADIARHQKALRIAEIEVPADVAAAVALAKKLEA